MGWNSWNTFGWTINEDLIKTTADLDAARELLAGANVTVPKKFTLTVNNDCSRACLFGYKNYLIFIPYTVNSGKIL